MKTIVYIHGASATPASFNYIRQNLPEHSSYDFSYDSTNRIEDTVNELYEALPEVEELNIVSHSLGGILALGVVYKAVELKVKTINKLVTLSSPMAGSKAASYLKWLYPGYGLFNNVSQSNPLILTIQDTGAIIPTLSVITSGGDIPIIKEKNDGVISVASQMAIKRAVKKVYELNHFEVLLSPDIVKEIKSFLW